MNDNDIIKALECCRVGKREHDCKKCPLYCRVPACVDHLTEAALDLINRQKAEIESLQKRYDLAVAEREANVKGFTEQLTSIKSEAIKEFAAKLKQKAYPFPCAVGVEYAVTIRAINDLVAELTEGTHGET